MIDKTMTRRCSDTEKQQLAQIRRKIDDLQHKQHERDDAEQARRKVEAKSVETVKYILDWRQRHENYLDERWGQQPLFGRQNPLINEMAKNHAGIAMLKPFFLFISLN